MIIYLYRTAAAVETRDIARYKPSRVLYSNLDSICQLAINVITDTCSLSILHEMYKFGEQINILQQ